MRGEAAQESFLTASPRRGPGRSMKHILVSMALAGLLVVGLAGTAQAPSVHVGCVVQVAFQLVVAWLSEGDPTIEPLLESDGGCDITGLYGLLDIHL
jgi:hypothetical protein